MIDAPHPDAAVQWLVFLKSEKPQSINQEFGFRFIPTASK
ncbi:MAG: hypothetical protein JWQ49_675 [Edaphobacter sp.]|nr:hypothetical protein [Edaphobacter sp.]